MVKQRKLTKPEMLTRLRRLLPKTKEGLIEDMEDNLERELSRAEVATINRFYREYLRFLKSCSLVNIVSCLKGKDLPTLPAYLEDAEDDFELLLIEAGAQKLEVRRPRRHQIMHRAYNRWRYIFEAA